MERAADLVTEVGYVPMDAERYRANLNEVPAASGTE
jgi:hypothetical protein